MTHQDSAPASDNYPRIERIRTTLERLNYRHDAVQAMLGPGPAEALVREATVPAAWRIRSILADAHAEPAQKNLARATGFFLLAHPLTHAELTETLGGEEAVEDFAAAHLIERTGAGWVAAVDVRPHAADNGTELWVTSDLGANQRPGVLRTDHVLGVGQASLTLAQFTERTPVARALDVGCGCGIQTFHLLSHAEHVTATDISARALAFTRFNLLLNAPALRIDAHNLGARVSLRAGSLLEPVAGERFDLVVSNPPFVITPRTGEEDTEAQRYTYRDGGMEGDNIVATLVRQLPGVLTEGGRAQMLGNWEIHSHGGEPQPWDKRPRAWVIEAGAGVDAWFIQRERLSPEAYAETWLKDSSENRDGDHYERAYTAYLEDFSRRNVHSVGFGMIWLRRTDIPAPGTVSGAPLRRFEEITYPIAQPIAPAIIASVTRHDQLTQLSDRDLRETHLRVAEDVTEERHTTPGAEHPSVILLRAGAGLRRTILLSTETAGFVSACDGQLSVGQIMDALAALLDWPPYPALTSTAQQSGTAIPAAAGKNAEISAAYRVETDDAGDDLTGAPEHPRDTLVAAIRELIEKGFLHFFDPVNNAENTSQEGE